jgi:hypothetical protein
MSDNSNFKPLTDPRRPTVQLVGRDGNAFVILGAVKRELQRAGYSDDEIDLYMTDARSRNYDHLLAVTSEWVNII